MNARGYKTTIGLAIFGLAWILRGTGRVYAGGEDLLRQQAIQKVRSAAQGMGRTAKTAVPLPRLPSGGNNKFKCLPTCDVTDGRFLAIAGQGLQTLSPPDLYLEISVPAGSTSFDVGIFDGDGGEYQNDGVTASWDAGATALYAYTLYADPHATGSAVTQVDLEPGVPVVLSDTMPDNDWIDFTVPTGPEAASPSGNFFYTLKIHLQDPSIVTLNAFKVRTSAILSGLALGKVAHPFSYIAIWTALSDIGIVYPAFPDAIPTTYDGTFRFFIDVPVSQTQIYLWDGDFDHGNADFTDQDTDDPDTPNAPFLPSWATSEVRPEGVAVGLNGNTGGPADDSNGDFAEYIVRSPAVRYSLLFPDGRSFLNDNPSGNLEWEQLMISTAPFDRSKMDFHSDSVPPGTYQLSIQGADMLNLNALMVPYRVVCVDAQGAPCKLLRPYLVGDTVFADTNGDGNQGLGENGIPGVVLELRDWNSALLATATTDANGHYTFETESGQYEVVVAAANFAAGGPLAGYSSTTGDSRTDTVLADNVLTYDFGYRGTGSTGNRVWYDINGNGIQDLGEPGLAGALLELRGAGGTLLTATATAADGSYTFSGLTGGVYTVTVATSSLPAGSIPSYDLDGVATPNTAVVPLTGGQSRTDADFGYRGVACPVQSAAGILVLDAADRVIATVTAAGDGSDTLYNLPAGIYKIRIVTAPDPRRH